MCHLYALHHMYDGVGSHQWRSEGQAWPGTCPTKAPCSSYSHARKSVRLMGQRTAGARPIPVTWLRYWITLYMQCACILFCNLNLEFLSTAKPHTNANHLHFLHHCKIVSSSSCKAFSEKLSLKRLLYDEPQNHKCTSHTCMS